METMTATKTTGICQVCERVCKLRNGKISTHGYERTGHGYIKGRCPGSNQAAWEVDSAALVAFVGSLRACYAVAVEDAARWANAAETMTEVIEACHDGIRTWVKGERYEMGGISADMFAITVANRKAETANRVKSLKAGIVYHETRLATR